MVVYVAYTFILSYVLILSGNFKNLKRCKGGCQRVGQGGGGGRRGDPTEYTYVSDSGNP